CHRCATRTDGGAPTGLRLSLEHSITIGPHPGQTSRARRSRFPNLASLIPLLGAHTSIAGGSYRAANAAGELGMDTVKIFTKNNNQWRAKPLSDEDVRLFREALAEHKLQIPCAHDSYLIHIGSPNDELWQKSLDALVVELERAEALGLAGVVMHPGSFVDSSEKGGLKRIVKGLNEAVKRTKGFAVELWLETTAGQGTNLGHRFEHIAEL